MTIKYIGNCSNINWNGLRNSLLNREGKIITMDLKNFNSQDKRYVEIFNNLSKANFNEDSAKWTNYYSGLDYSQSVDNVLLDWLGLNGLHKTWVSRIDPGYYAPWHWDVDDYEEEYLKKGSIRRFSGFIDPKEKGMAHVFTIEKDAICNTNSGDFYEWSNYKSWHSGMNGGLYSKFMYHVLGW